MFSDSFNNKYMKIAFEQAALAVGKVQPNPAVGAVLVSKSGKIIGRGFTQKPGSSHAEICAIADAHNNGCHDLSNSSLYVTLEPCCHFGKTPPCCDAILFEKIQRVVIATVDSSEKVNGKSIKRLINEGVKVHLLDATDFQEEKFFTLAPFFFADKNKKPLSIIKIATTKDNFIAPQNGASGPITSELARQIVQRYRALFHCTFASSGTVLVDFPSLNARISENKLPLPKNTFHNFLLNSCTVNFGKSAKRVFAIPETTKFNLKNFSEKQRALGGWFRLWNRNVTKELSSEFVEKIINIAEYRELLKHLYSSGIISMMIETGPTFLQYLFDEQLIDVFIIIQSAQNSRWKNGISLDSVISRTFIQEKYKILKHYNLPTGEIITIYLVTPTPYT